MNAYFRKGPVLQKKYAILAKEFSISWYSDTDL
jgi:hypothetical protein